MNRVIVVRTAGQPQIANAIADGINAHELEIVRRENIRLNAINGVRAYGDSVRVDDACKALAVKYKTPKHGQLYRAIWGCIGVVVLAVNGWCRYLTAWNREP